MTPEPAKCAGCGAAHCVCAEAVAGLAAVEAAAAGVGAAVKSVEAAAPRNLEDVTSLPVAFELRRKDFLYNAEQRQRKRQIMTTFRQVS